MTERRSASRVASLAASLLAVASIGTAHAQAAGDFVVGTGWLFIAPQVSTQPLNTTLSLGGRQFSQTDTGVSAQINQANTIGLTASYFVTDHIAAELVLGIPPKFKINGAGSAESFNQIGSARMWSPTVLAKYYFGKPTAKLRPFLGVGVSYVWFSNAQITNDAFLRSKGLGNTSVSVNKGFAPVFNAGLSYNVHKNFFLNASVSFMPLTRNITLDSGKAGPGGAGTAVSTVRTRMNPVVTYVGLGYRF